MEHVPVQVLSAKRRFQWDPVVLPLLQSALAAFNPVSPDLVCRDLGLSWLEDYLPTKKRRLSADVRTFNVPCLSTDILPNEMWMHIFSFLEPAFLGASVMRVCKHWNQLAASPSLWKAYQLPGYSKMEVDEFIRVLCLPQLAKLSHISCGWNHKVDDKLLEHLFRSNPRLATSLLSFEIHRCNGITNTSMKKLSTFPQLQKLRLFNSSNWRGIDDGGLFDISKIKGLQTLQLNYFKRITNDGLLFLRNLTDLKELHLSGSILISDEGIENLSSLNQLQSLTLSLCGKLTDRTLRVIAKNFPHLRYLSLGYNNPSSVFTNEGLMELAALKELKELRLDRSWGLLGGNGIALLKSKLPDLVVKPW